MKTPKTTEAMVEEFANALSWYDLPPARINEIVELHKEHLNQIHIQSALEAEGRKPIFGEPEDGAKKYYIKKGQVKALTDLADYHRSKVIE